MTSNPRSEELLPPAAADRGSGVRLTQTDEISIINRRGRSTYPQEKSVRRSGATPYIGHRNASSTQIYAKVAIDRLRSVALGDGEEVL